MGHEQDKTIGWILAVLLIGLAIWLVPRVKKAFKNDANEPFDDETSKAFSESESCSREIHASDTLDPRSENKQGRISRDIVIDPAKLSLLHGRLRSQQNLIGGILAGMFASMIGAIVWAVITVTTEHQIGFMAIGVGFLAGYAIQIAGKGIDRIFGVIGAVLALLGCAIGNLLGICWLLAKHNDISFFTVLSVLEYEAVINLMSKWFSPIDLLFYGIAGYEGYKFAFRRLTDAELETVVTS